MTSEPTSPHSSETVCVAIVNYRTANLVIAALPALLEELAPYATGRTVIVDNQSPGDDADVLEQYVRENGIQDRVRVVRSSVNGGFAWGNNVAFSVIREAGWHPDAVLMLNPDAEIRPGSIAAMMAVLRDHEEAGIVGARLENPDGTSWVGAFHFPTLLSEFAQDSSIGTLERWWPTLAKDSAEPVPVDWVSGAATLIRWRIMDRLRGLDMEYFLYFEEVDLMHRARGMGWQTWHAPDARVLHHAGSSTGMADGKPREGGMPDYWFDSWKRYYVQNHGTGYARLATLARITGIVLAKLHRTLRGKPYHIPPGFIVQTLRTCVFGDFSKAQRPARLEAPDYR